MAPLLGDSIEPARKSSSAKVDPLFIMREFKRKRLKERV